MNNDGSPTGVIVWENYNKLTNKWYEVRACAVQWLEGRMVRLSIASDITQRRQTEKKLKTKEKKLEKKAVELEEVNIALNILLEKRDEDKKQLEENVLGNVKELISPYLRKLKKSHLDDKQRIYLVLLESHLKDIISPFLGSLTSKYLGLTPSEIHVAGLVKEGKTTKEIAELLNSSQRTIEFHRNSIRAKLDLKNKKVNLRTYLLTLA